MSDPFAPTEQWRRLPPAAVTARRVTALLANLGAGIVAVVAAGLWLGWGWWTLGVGLVAAGWIGWRVVRAGRWTRSVAYLERDTDLLITRGLWNRRFSAVPYGRMLSVEVASGPISRMWGLASVSLVTASIESAAVIPDVTLAEANRLRDHLIAAGQAQSRSL